MNKLLLACSFLMLMFLGIGTATAPDNAMFWLASTSSDVQAVRIALGVIIFMLLVTRPPRHILTRIVASVVAIGTGAFTLFVSLSGYLPLLDVLALVVASVSTLIMALELDVEPAESKMAFSAARNRYSHIS